MLVDSIAVNAAYLVANYSKKVFGINSKQYAVWLSNTVSAYMLNLDMCQARNVYIVDSLLNEAKNIWMQYPDKETEVDYANFLGTLGLYYNMTNQQQSAEECYKESILIHKNLKSPEKAFLYNLLRLATLYVETNRADEAINIYMALYGRATQLKEQKLKAEICSHLAVVYNNKKENFDRAEKYALESYAILNEIEPQSVAVAKTDDLLSTISFNMGLNRKAINYKLHALKIKQQNKIQIKDEEFLGVYESFIDAYDDVYRDFPDSLRNFTVSVIKYCEELVNETNKPIQLRIKAFRIMGKINMFSKNYTEAQNSFETCLNLQSKISSARNSDVLTTMNNLAFSYLLGRNYDKCREITERIIKIDHSSTAFKNYENLLAAGIFSNDSLLVEKSLKKVYEGTLDYLTSHFLFLTTDEREQFVDDGNIGISNLMLPSLFFQNDNKCAEIAFNAALVSKGLLLNAIESVDNIVINSKDKNILFLYDKLKSIEYKLSNAVHSDSIEFLTNAQQNIEKEMLSQIRTYQDYTKDIVTDWENVRQSLPLNALAVEFVVADKSVLDEDDDTETYCAVLLRKEWKHPKFVVLSDKRKTDKLIRQIISSFNNSNGMGDAQWRYVSNQLYGLLFNPLQPFLKGVENIFFSPIDMLCIAPIEALSNKNGVCLFEKYNIHRLTSTRELCKKNMNTDKGEVVLFGGLTYENQKDKTIILQSGKERYGWKELPETDAEINKIAKLYSDKGFHVSLYSKEKGSENAFMALSGQNISALHIATHGFYFDGTDMFNLPFFRDSDNVTKKQIRVNPLKRTGIMLSGGQAAWLGLNHLNDADDGVLFASEIKSMDFHKVNLIVLSACQTGLGDISDDGVIGLQRAFKMAGAKTIVMSLWKVDDKATSLMMSSFYKEILNGHLPNEAFALARNKVKGQFKEPFYWAPFILLD